MMVGHAALAFALAGGVAHYVGVGRERALLFGLVAGAFAVVPDVDMGYAVVGIATAGTTDLSTLQAVFWESGLTVHRGLTHSLLVAGVAAVLFGLVAYRGPIRLLALGALGVLVAGAFVLGDSLAAGVMGSFVVAGVLVAVGAGRLELDPRDTLAAAAVGMLTHPFGDVFTGTAPTLLAPFDVRFLPERVVFADDATVHLLVAFGIEITILWVAATVYLRLRGEPVGQYLHPGAVVGMAYAGMVFVLPPPTLEVSYQFVFSVLAFGIVGAFADLPVPDLRSPHSRRAIVLTGLATISIAWLSYFVGYLLVG